MRNFLLRTLERIVARRDRRLAEAAGANGTPAEAVDDLVAAGELFERAGDFQRALDHYRDALSRQPPSALLQVCAGNVLLALARPAEAEAHYRRAIELDPDYAAARLNLGNALYLQQRFAEAEASYRVALRLRPDWAEAWVGLGCALEPHDPPAALEACRAALRHDGAHAGAAFNAAGLLVSRGELGEARAILETVLARNPGHAALKRKLADLFRAGARHAEALRLYDELLAADPDDIDAASNRLFTLAFLPESTPNFLLEEHRAWARRFADPLPPLAPRPTGRAEGPLRIGYLSPDFVRHPVALFIGPVLRAHDRQVVETFCYANHAQDDGITAELRAAADHWRPIHGVDDDAVAALIAGDGIDILVDLAGHTAGNRLRVFARRPAPVQMTWLGYLSTTGMSQIDYRLCDALTDPPGVAEAWQVEAPLRLPDSQWCYGSPVAIGPSPLPYLARGYWTFGSFNQAAKLNPPLLAAWADLLSSLSGSRLRIAGVVDPQVIGEVAAVFAARGIARDRLDFAPRMTLEQYLASHAEVDLALDSFPYTGGTTTCDALYAGVPVATIAGDRSVARSGVSLLTTVGLADWIAPALAELPALVRRHLADPARLAALRTELHARMRVSPLMDARRFTRNLEALYRRAAGRR